MFFIQETGFMDTNGCNYGCFYVARKKLSLLYVPH